MLTIADSDNTKERHRQREWDFLEGVLPLSLSLLNHEMSGISSFTTKRLGFESKNISRRLSPLAVDSHGNFVEKSTGRRLKMHGINFASNAKLPATPQQATYFKPDRCGLYSEGDSVSFVGKPFPLSEAYEHVTRIKQCGFNTIRFVFTWEAIEHEAPGVYDLEYADYVVAVMKVIEEVGGIYIFLDPHQDVWSRFTGGSGAPLWTLYAAGLEPKNFKHTLAARIHYDSTKPEDFTKMVWATNYYRLASELMFTMFFNGKVFFPKCIINGVNIQDFLQDHFNDSVAFLVNHIKTHLPSIFETCFMGVESMNEPNTGMYGYTNLNNFPEDLELKLDEMPTPIQSLRLGMGIAQTIDKFHLSIFGPTKKGQVLWEPNGNRAWIDNDSMDKKYGFQRGHEWKLGECIFAQHGVWDPSTGELLRADYFKANPQTGELLTQLTFNEGPFMDFWYDFKRKIHEIDSNLFLIMQIPVFTVPPKLKNKGDLEDGKTIIALHYYDGMSLMFKTWNKFMNVDTFGIVRGKYLNPIFSIVLGERNIRKLISKQLREMKQEANLRVGKNIPIIFTETGMPYDMDSKIAFRTGDFKSQESANDALLTALEENNLNFTYWNYNPDNNHKWGDDWNLEDFSIWSRDDLDNLEVLEGESYEEWIHKNSTVISLPPKSATNTDTTMSTYHKEVEAEEQEESQTPNESTFSINLLSGIRCPRAIIRPYVCLSQGIVKHFQFDINSKELKVDIHNPKVSETEDETARLVQTDDENSFKDEDGQTPHHATIIYLPENHFPEDSYQIEVNVGDIVVNRDGINQWIEWSYPKCQKLCSILVTPLSYDLGSDRSESSSIKSGLKALACGYL